MEETQRQSICDVSPLEPWAQFEAEQVYRHLNSHPVTGASHSAPHAHTGVSLLSVRDPRRLDREYTARALTYCFLMALGQARLTHGAGGDAGGDAGAGGALMGRDLPSPVCVQLVQTEGQHFHFAAFQLNTLRLGDDEGVKNIFWEGEAEDGWTDEWGDAGQHRSRLFEVCDNVKAVPTLDGYNPKVFDRFLAMYLNR